MRVTPGGDLMINVQRVGAGAAVHLIRYDFDPEQDRTPPLPELTIELRLPERFGRLSVHSPGGADDRSAGVRRARAPVTARATSRSTASRCLSRA